MQKNMKTMRTRKECRFKENRKLIFLPDEERKADQPVFIAFLLDNIYFSLLNVKGKTNNQGVEVPVYFIIDTFMILVTQTVTVQ